MEPKRIRALIGLGILVIIMLIFLIPSLIKNEIRIIETETEIENEIIQEEPFSENTTKEVMSEMKESISENVFEENSTLKELSSGDSQNLINNEEESMLL